MKQAPDKSHDLQGELEALRKRIAELESNEAELSWAHDTLIGQISQEHKQTETALRLSEQKLSRIFAASPDAIAITSLVSGDYVDVNPAYERLFGYSPQEAIGRQVVSMGVWPGLAQRQGFIERLREQGEIINHEIRFRHKSGRQFEAQISASLIELGGAPCMLTITRDISDRKRIEQLFLEQNLSLIHI